MNVIISPTGYGPITFEAKRDAAYARQDLERRSVSISIWESVDDWWYAELKYLTTWEIERNFTRLFVHPSLSRACVSIREAAKTMFPPGAGYPAMPQFETRQAKLQGMLETLTLVALSEVLRQVSE